MGHSSNAGSDCLVSVIIPAHNAESTLGEQLEALCRQTVKGDFEVIVVLNRCTDRTRAVAESFSGQLSALTVVVADETASSTYARNAGAGSAKGELLLFCDADDVVGGAWVEEMVAALQMADIVGGRLVPLEPVLPWALRCSAILPEGGLSNATDHLLYAISASVGARREVFENESGWDERFGAASDDMAFSVAAQRNGYRVGYAPEALCHYRVHSTLRDVLKQQRRYGRGHAVFIRHYAPEAYPGAMAWTLRTLSAAYRRARSVRRFDDVKVHLAWLVQRVFYLLALLRSDRRQSGAGGLPSRPNVDYLLTKVGYRLRPLRKRNLYRAAVGRRLWNQPVVDFTVPLSTPVLGGLCLTAPENVAHPYTSRWTEPGTLAVLERSLRHGDRVLDIGANIGWISVAAARLVGAQGVVTAVEANSALVPVLEANLRRHSAPGAAIVNAAAGNRRGRISFNIFPNSLLSGPANSPYTNAVARTQEVDRVIIDDLGLSELALIKMDVEGYEPEVLDGCTETFARSPGVLLIAELNPSCLVAAGHSIGELTEHPLLRGWARWVIEDTITADHRRIITPFPDVTRESSAPDTDAPWFANVLFVPPSRCEWFETVFSDCVQDAARPAAIDSHLDRDHPCA